jgi:subtilisin family serine protease
MEDWFGHGTHIAGILVGNTYGVAKKATLRSVKILDRNGKTNASTIIKSIGYVVNATLERQVPSIINLSLSGPRSAAVNAMIRVAVQNNITVIGSGGNDAEDACLHTPASEPLVLAVGALTRKNTIASFSNIGPCIDIFAPGDKIFSTYLTREGKRPWSRKKMSGSSMSAPFVTGVAAILLSLNTSLTPRDVRTMISSMATVGQIRNPSNNTINAIVYI